jgi:lysophospholipase L1-like esterase
MIMPRASEKVSHAVTSHPSPSHQPDGMHWVGTWTTAPMPVEGVALARQTIRNICRISIGGSSVRVRISNSYGTGDLHVGAVHLGVRREDASIVDGSGRSLTFNGSASITVPAGALVLSDPVNLDVAPLVDLAVSVYLPDEVPQTFQSTGHDPAHQTNYISPRGEFVSEIDMPHEREIEAFLFVTGIDVLAPRDVGGVVAFGDSLTEGNISRLDANNRWPDQLARRFVARPSGRQLGVVNQGVGGGRMLHDGHGESGLRRFDRDVLAQPGATHVVVLLGVNDLRNSQRKLQEVVTAHDLIAGLHQLAARAHAAGLMTVVGTVMPWENETFNGGNYTLEGEAARQTLNAWIRNNTAFDMVIDFEAALRDPSHPARMLPEWDSGDHLHPSDAGYLHMADSINLSNFDY